MTALFESISLFSAKIKNKTLNPVHIMQVTGYKCNGSMGQSGQCLTLHAYIIVCTI